MQNRAALFAVNNERKTPLDLGREKGHSDIVEYIISHKFHQPKFTLDQFMHPELSRYVSFVRVREVSST